jgi:disulfide bond formation protein DsbB
MKIYFAWIIALGGLLLSFYYSEVKGYEPCRLCWLERLCLFPLAIQLGIAAYKGDAKGIKIYALPLSSFGFGVSFFQTILPWLKIHHLCGAGPDCTKGVMLFGAIPFSWVSAVGFALITLFLLSAKGKTVDS